MIPSVVAVDNLLRHSGWGDVDADDFLREFAALLAGNIGCSSAGVRLRVQTPSRAVVLRIAVLYERGPARTIQVPDVAGPGIDEYLATVARGGGLMASRVDADPRVPAQLRRQLAQRGVRSVLDAAISVNGAVYGAVTCEERRASMPWSPSQVHAIRRVAVRVGPTIVRLFEERLKSIGRTDCLAVEPRHAVLVAASK